MEGAIKLAVTVPTCAVTLNTAYVDDTRTRTLSDVPTCTIPASMASDPTSRVMAARALAATMCSAVKTRSERKPRARRRVSISSLGFRAAPARSWFRRGVATLSLTSFVEDSAHGALVELFGSRSEPLQEGVAVGRGAGRAREGARGARG